MSAAIANGMANPSKQYSHKLRSPCQNQLARTWTRNTANLPKHKLQAYVNLTHIQPGTHYGHKISNPIHLIPTNNERYSTDAPPS